MKTLYKILGAVAILIALVVIFVLIAGNKKFDAPYPDITASSDATVIERGRHLVFGPSHCASCHAAPRALAEMDDGAMKPLIGGMEMDIPPVTLRAANLTPDMETGIGSFTDGEIARAVRYGIGRDGHFMIPVMEYSRMSDEDLTAIISYLRAQPAVSNKVEKTEFKFLGKALLAFGVLKPKQFTETPPKSVSKDDIIAYGEYIATGVANCVGCHTNTDLMSGEFIVPPFAGGFYFEPEAMTEGYGFVSPNLTPDRETGIMANWTEEVFINRMKAGRVHKTSPMPWGAFTNLDSMELSALFRFLQSLEPVNNAVGQTVFQPGEL